MTNKSKYSNLYQKIVENARTKEYNCYTEIHHIIPRCIGGTDDPDNLVRVSYREHYILHYLLTKMYDSDSLVYAFCAMNHMNVNKYSNSRLYESAKKIWIENIKMKPRSIECKNKISNSWTEERKESHRKKVSGENHWTSREPKEKVEKITEIMRDNITDEHRRKQGDSLRERYRNDPDLRKKVGDASRGKKKEVVLCPHCGKAGGKPAMVRYHFENCKEIND